MLLKMVFSRIFVVIVFLLGCFQQSDAQDTYKLLSCPQVCLKSKNEFNEKHQYCDSDTKFQEALMVQFAGCTGGVVKYGVLRSNNDFETFSWTIGKEAKKVNMVSLSSKGRDKNILESETDIKHFFDDTIAIAKEIKIRVRFYGKALKRDGYFFKDLSTGEIYNIPAVRDTLVISVGLFPKHTKDFNLVLFNSDKPQKQLAEFSLHVLSIQEIEEITEIVSVLRTTSGFSDDVITRISNYLIEPGLGKLKSSDVQQLK